uniref:Uncharacterized protein n=1 Tax=Daphnia galeata TaxID=27404 RepID=A0A8J2WV34_9CRUS|nr:unnamed protein product [Daphnia galeata]
MYNSLNSSQPEYETPASAATANDAAKFGIALAQQQRGSLLKKRQIQQQQKTNFTRRAFSWKYKRHLVASITVIVLVPIDL